MVDLVVPAIADLPTPSSGFKTMVWRGVALYQLDASYWPVKNADGQWLYDKASTAGSSNAAIRATTNGAAGGGYFAGSNTDTFLFHNCENINGTGFVARQATASYIRQAGGNIEFYANTGLTVGAAFSPTLRFSINGTTGLSSTPGPLTTGGPLTVSSGGAAITGNSTVTGSATITSNTNIQGTLFLGAPLVCNLAADATTFYMRGAQFAVQNAAATTTFLFVSSTVIGPGGDNITSGGQSFARYSVIFAATGAINTSDARLKKWRGGLDKKELAAARQIAAEIGVFQWLESIAEKGDAARLHIGVLAQRVFKIMEACGLRWQDYGWCCYDRWDDQYRAKFKKVIVPAVLDDDGNVIEGEKTDLEPDGEELWMPAGDRYGVRPDQLAMFLIAAQEQRLAVLEAAMA